jgi:hypothetical protein
MNWEFRNGIGQIWEISLRKLAKPPRNRNAIIEFEDSLNIDLLKNGIGIY